MRTKLDLSAWVLERLNLDYEHMRHLAQEELADLEHLQTHGDRQMVNVTPSIVKTADYALFALSEVCQYEKENRNNVFLELLEYRCLPLTRLALLEIIEKECLATPKRKG